nr:hypothetical protein [Tanacetum cinerariifolium]
EREVSCEAQQGQSGVKRKLFRSFRNKIGNEPILALPEGSDNFVVMREAGVRMRDVRTLIMEEAHAMKYSVRLGVNEAVARHGVHVSSIPDRDVIYIKVLGRDVEVVRNTSRYESGRSPVLLAEIRESKMIELELEQETTKVVVITERLKEAKDRQES